MGQPAFLAYLEGAIAVLVSVRLPFQAVTHPLCLSKESVG